MTGYEWFSIVWNLTALALTSVLWYRIGKSRGWAERQAEVAATIQRARDMQYTQAVTTAPPVTAPRPDRVDTSSTQRKGGTPRTPQEEA